MWSNILPICQAGNDMPMFTLVDSHGSVYTHVAKHCYPYIPGGTVQKGEAYVELEAMKMVMPLKVPMKKTNRKRRKLK